MDADPNSPQNLKQALEQARQRIAKLEHRRKQDPENRLGRRLFEYTRLLITHARNHPLHRVMSRALEEMASLTDSPVCFFALVDPDRKPPFVKHWSRGPLDFDAGRKGAWTECLRRKKPVIQNNEGPGGQAPVIRELVVPVLDQDTAAALVGVRNKGSDYTARDVEILSLLGHVIHEIVSWKRADEERARAVRQWQAAIDATLDGIWFMDAESRISYCNKMARSMLRRPLQDIIGRCCWEVAHGTQHPVADCPFERTKKSRRREEMTFRAGDRWLQAIVDPILDARGGVAGAIHILRDITGQKRTEEALRQERDRAEAYLHLSAVIFVALDTRGNVTLVNRKGCKILGRPLQEILGKNWFEHFIPAHERDKVRSVYLKLMDGEIEPNETYENAVLTRNGEERMIAWHNAVIKDDQGDIIGTLSSGEDVTELRRIEKERRSLEAQLRLSQKMESIGRLAGGVAHDFNNLLTVINNYAEMVQDTLGQDDPRREDLKRILEAGQRAADLTRQLLAFSRKQPMELKTLDLNAVVSGMKPMLERLIGEDIEFHVKTGDDLGHVRADRAQIEQVIMNLVVNARDAMPTGGVLSVETANVVLDEGYAAAHQGVVPGPYVMLAVSDTGCGMDETVRERIFEPFYTTKEKGLGTGLGLAVVYGVVKQFGGHIWVCSEPGRGSTFRIYLPRVKPGEILSSKEETLELGGHETILVVEDEKSVREPVVRILEKAGYTVIQASGGEEALVRCETAGREIALVLTDVVMPRMSGKALVDRLLARYPKMKVLFMSGYTDPTISRHGVLEKGVHFIAKPFSAEALLKKVRQVLNGD